MAMIRDRSKSLIGVVVAIVGGGCGRSLPVLGPDAAAGGSRGAMQGIDGSTTPPDTAVVGGDGGGGGGADGASTGVPRWPGNAADCPAARPAAAPQPLDPATAPSDSICTVAEGQSCVWWSTREGVEVYEACTCYEQNSSIRRWYCQAGIVPAGCPHEQPASGASCTPGPSDGCPFPPRTTCRCDNGIWSCADETSGGYYDALSPPATMDLSMSVSGLSDADALAWCGWFVSLGHFRGPYAREATVTAEGYVGGFGGIAWEVFFVNACMPDPQMVAASQCAQNLRAQTCSATLGELTDCILTIEKGLPHPHGCGRFFEHADCSGIIVRRLWPEGADDLPRDDPMACFSLRVR